MRVLALLVGATVFRFAGLLVSIRGAPVRSGDRDSIIGEAGGGTPRITFSPTQPSFTANFLVSACEAAFYFLVLYTRAGS